LKKRRKSGRSSSSKRMVHTAVVLPPELLERLRQDGEVAGHGLSGEIRLRLQTTYLFDAHKHHDRKTASLLSAIRHLSEMVERNVRKKWHEHAYAHAAFRAGVLDFLTRQKPPGEANKRPDAALEEPDDDPPEAVGRTLARVIVISDQDGLDDEDPCVIPATQTLRG
jgi:hypothetical protein